MEDLSSLDFEPFWPLLDTKVGGFLPLWTRFWTIKLRSKSPFYHSFRETTVK